jgi:integrase
MAANHRSRHQEIPSENIKQRRRTAVKREQNGQIIRISGRWYVRHWERRNIGGQIERKRVAHLLGEVTTRGKHPPDEIKQLAKDHMRKMNDSKVEPFQVVTLVDFAENTWLPYVEEHEKPSTLRSHKNRWKNHLKAHCDGLWLRNVRCCDVQRILEAIARPDKLGKNSLKRMKAILSAIFSFAKQQGYYDGVNPAHDAKIPEARAPKETYAYNLDEIRSMLAVLPDTKEEPAGAVVATAAYAGLREGEIEGLEWEDYTGSELCIRRSIWEGHVTTPKTDASADVVPIIKSLAARLDMHRLRCGNPSKGPIFRNGLGNHESLSNIRTRQVLPVLERCGVCRKAEDEHGRANHEYVRDASLPEWHGWHAFRRGLATNLHELDVPDKLIQKILRHKDVKVTQACYILPRDPAIAAAMERLEERLSTQDTYRTLKPVPAKTPASVN